MAAGSLATSTLTTLFAATSPTAPATPSSPSTTASPLNTPTRPPSTTSTPPTARLTRHGRTHDLDTTRIAITGDSTGANLAAALTLRLRNTHRPPISHQTLVYPLLDTDLTTPTYHDYGTDYLLTTQGIQLLLDAYTPDSALRTNPDIAPLQATDPTNLPPALIHTAEYDPLRHEAETYAHKLHTAGVDFTLTQWDGMIHGFYELLDTLDTAQDGLNHIATHITAAL